MEKASRLSPQCGRRPRVTSRRCWRTCARTRRDSSGRCGAQPCRKVRRGGAYMVNDARGDNSPEDWVRSRVASFLPRARAETLRNSDDLLVLLSSLQVLRLVMLVESTYGIKVENAELTPDNLASVEKIAALIGRKRPAEAGRAAKSGG